MNTHADKSTEKNSNAFANRMDVQQAVEQEVLQIEDNRSEAVAQRTIQETANNSEQVKQLKALQEMANSSEQVKQLRTVQAVVNEQATQLQSGVIQRQPKPNVTGSSKDSVKLANLVQPEDNRPEAITQRKIQEAAIDSRHVMQLKAIHAMAANSSPQIKQLRAVQVLANSHNQQTTLPIQFFGKVGEFLDKERLDAHYQKHCVDDNNSGGVYASAAEYETAAIDITKTVAGKANKGGGVSYWKESTKQFVTVSKPAGGYIQTLFTKEKADYEAGLKA